MCRRCCCQRQGGFTQTAASKEEAKDIVGEMLTTKGDAKAAVGGMGIPKRVVLPSCRQGYRRRGRQKCGLTGGARS